MKKWIVWASLIFGFVGALVVVFFRGAFQTPLTVQWLGTTNDPSGNQIAYCWLSNHTRKPVVFLGDATSLPCYQLDERRLIDSTNRMFTITNHNFQAFLKSKPTTLPPQSGLSFPVQIPASATGAVFRLCYLRQKTSVEEKIRDTILRIRRRSSETYKTIEVPLP